MILLIYCSSLTASAFALVYLKFFFFPPFFICIKICIPFWYMIQTVVKYLSVCKILDELFGVKMRNALT